MPQLKMTVEVEEQFLYDILTTFVESGWSTWALFHEVNREVDTKDVLSFTIEEEDDDSDPVKLYEVGIDELMVGLGRLFSDESDVDHVPCGSSHLEEIQRGVREGDAGDVDAIGADIIVQAAIFGELVYG